MVCTPLFHTWFAPLFHTWFALLCFIHGLLYFMQRLQFAGITADQWRAVLKFLYTGELIVEVEQVEELYNAVSQLQLQELEGLLQ